MFDVECWNFAGPRRHRNAQYFLASPLDCGTLGSPAGAANQGRKAVRPPSRQHSEHGCIQLWIGGLLEIKPGDSVLETSVGTGLNFKYLPRAIKRSGVDLSAEMLRSEEHTSELQSLRHL